MSDALRFSVIMPVCHGGRFLREALSTASRLDYPPEAFEVIVSGRPGDAAAQEAVSGHPACARGLLRYAAAPSGNRSAMLNAACALARGDILVFTDDDCTLPPDWLQRLDAAWRRDPDAGMLGGQDLHSEPENAFGAAVDWVLNSFLGAGGVRRGRGAPMGDYFPRLWNMALPRAVAAEIRAGTADGLRLFNESLAVHEDVELAHRVRRSGRRIVFAPDVCVGHARDTTLRSFLRRNFRMARTCRSVGVHRLPHTLLAAAVVGAVLLAAASAFSPPCRVALGALAGAYALMLAGGGIAAALQRRNVRLLFHVPVLLGGVHAARGIGFLWPWPLDESRPRGGA